MKSEVFVLGSIQAYMLKNPGFGFREFFCAMANFKPDLILTATRSDHPGFVDGSIDGGIEQSLVYAFAEESNIKIAPVDWFDDDYLEEVKRDTGPKNFDDRRQLQAAVHEYQRAVIQDPFTVLQNSITQAKVKKIFALSDSSGLTARRHAHLWQNILQSRNETARRILVVGPLDTKYFLDERFTEAGDDLLMPANFTTIPQLGTFQIPGPLVARSLKNMTEARSVLKKRLQNGFYKGAAKERLATKLKEFDVWIDAFS